MQKPARTALLTLALTLLVAVAAGLGALFALSLERAGIFRLPIPHASLPAEPVPAALPILPSADRSLLPPPRGAAASPSALLFGDDESSTVEIFRRSSPAVVYITSSELRGRLFSPQVYEVYEVPKGEGAGFLWDREGHVVTNYHVVHGAHQLMVSLHDGSQREATLAGTAPEYDLAVLRINPEGIETRPLPVGDSADLQVGRKVLAIGNPFGFDASLSVGVVSALGREIAGPAGLKMRNVIQTDAAINPGNSGGPLLDSSGRLVGVNTVLFSPSGASAGIGFAIPVNTVTRVVPQLIEYGRVRRARLGIQVASDSWSRYVGVRRGVVVIQVLEGLPAARSGMRGISKDRRGVIKIGDVILALNGQPVANEDDLFLLLEQIAPGDEVLLLSQRDKEEREYRIRVE